MNYWKIVVKTQVTFIIHFHLEMLLAPMSEASWPEQKKTERASHHNSNFSFRFKN